MRVTAVTLELGLTLSPKQYESVRSHGSVTLELAEGDDPDAAFVQAHELIRKHVEAQASYVITKNWS